MFYGQRNRSRGFLVRLITAHATGQTADEFAEQEIALMQAERDPMVPDYTALAAEEPTSQIEDCRDSAEAPSAQ